MVEDAANPSASKLRVLATTDSFLGLFGLKALIQKV